VIFPETKMKLFPDYIKYKIKKHMKIYDYSLFEKKKRKTEEDSIDDKYDEYTDKILKFKKEAIVISEDKTLDSKVKTIKLKIKRFDIQLAEKELEIIKIRDKKLISKKDLKTVKEDIKKKNKKK